MEHVLPCASGLGRPAGLVRAHARVEDGRQTDAHGPAVRRQCLSRMADMDASRTPSRIRAVAPPLFHLLRTALSSPTVSAPYPVRSMHGPLAPPPQCTLTRYGSPPSRLAARRQERLPWILWGGSPLGTAVLSRIRLCPGAGPPYAIPTRGPPNGWCSAPRMDTIWEKSPAYEHPPPPCSNDTRPRASSARGPPACRLAGVTARTGGAARPARAGRAGRTVRQPPPISPRARAHDTVRVRPRPRGPSAAPLRSRHRASTGGYPQSFLVMDPVRRVGTNASPSPVPHTGSVAAAQLPRGCSAAKMAAPTPARCVSSPGAAGCLHAAV